MKPLAAPGSELGDGLAIGVAGSLPLASAPRAERSGWLTGSSPGVARQAP